MLDYPTFIFQVLAVFVLSDVSSWRRPGSSFCAFLRLFVAIRLRALSVLCGEISPGNYRSFHVVVRVATIVDNAELASFNNIAMERKSIYVSANDQATVVRNQ